MMVGRDVLLNVEKQDKIPGSEILTVQKISVYNNQGLKVVNEVSISVCKNQIVGIAGVEGNGQSELTDAIFGILPIAQGTVLLGSDNLSDDSIKQRRQKGLAYIPEDRITTGIAGSVSIWENLFADKIDRFSKGAFGLLDLKKIRTSSKDLIAKHNIVSINEDQTLQMLSGGNMQKVVVARELSSNPTVLIANQPTRGIDVGAQEFIWKEIIKFRDNGNGVLLVSADLNELLELSDVVLVMYKGEIVATLQNKENAEISEDEIGLYMLGVKRQGEGGQIHEQ